jgi:glutamine amidotransferase
MIAIIDYGVGNLYSLHSSLNFLGIENVLTADKKILDRAAQIILPGVGAFSEAKKRLDDVDLSEMIKILAAAGKPLLGICLGMQLLFEKSFEYGEHLGLGLIGGQVCPLEPDLGGLKVPHIGWNSLSVLKKDPLLKYVADGAFVYYVHSYYAKNCDADTIAVSDYGVRITAAVRRGNVMGTQFHPEKSGKTGLSILKAFSEIV